LTPAIITALEAGQVVVALVGLTTAVLEWSAVVALRGVGRTEAQRLLARHALWIECLRATVHVVILLTASLSLLLPMPPDLMPHWIVDVLVLRKFGVLVVALIATAGTVSARVTRLRVAASLRAAAHEAA
jgi:hypothetical protein